MAFSDLDIHCHLRKIGLKHGRLATNYQPMGIPDPKHEGEGKVPHMVEVRLKNQAIMTLAGTRQMSEGNLMKPMHWARVDEVKE